AAVSLSGHQNGLTTISVTRAATTTTCSSTTHRLTIVSSSGQVDGPTSYLPSPTDGSAGTTCPGDCEGSGSGGGVADAARADQAGVDRGLLLGLGGVGQVREIVGAHGMDVAGEARIQSLRDLGAGVQAFMSGPGSEVRVPGLAGG